MADGLTIRTERKFDYVLVTVVGRVDAFNCIEMEEKINEAFLSKSDIRINMKNVDFLCSSGIRILIAAYKKAKKWGYSLGIEEPSRSVVSCLGMTNLQFLVLQ